VTGKLSSPLPRRGMKYVSFPFLLSMHAAEIFVHSYLKIKISCDCEVVIIVLTKIMQGNNLQLIIFATDNHVITHQKHSMKMTKKITRKLWKKIGLSPWRKLMNQIRGKWDNENDTNV
jgi:hypothetical protein